MAGSRAGKKPSFTRSSRSTDITGVLTLEEKTALTNLVFDITARMENRIISRFDNVRPPVAADNPQHSLLIPSMKPNDVSNKENQPPISSRRTSVPTGPRVPHTARGTPSRPSLAARGNHTGVTPVEGGTRGPRSVPVAQEMKKELLVVYSKWQNGLVSRVKDLSVKDPATNPTAAARGGRGGRGVASRGRGGRTDHVAVEDTRASNPPTRAGNRGGLSNPYSRATGELRRKDCSDM